MAGKPDLSTELGWIAEQVAMTARQWNCDDRVAATLWWYMNSSDVFASAVTVTDPDTASLRRELGAMIDGLAAAGGAGPASLWAIATDSLANRALDATPGRAGADRALELATSIGDPLPPPRFVEVRGRVFVRRTSCCLIYLTGSAPKCVSCPKWPPEQREAMLAALVERGR